MLQSIWLFNHHAEHLKSSQCNTKYKLYLKNRTKQKNTLHIFNASSFRLVVALPLLLVGKQLLVLVKSHPWYHLCPCSSLCVSQLLKISILSWHWISDAPASSFSWSGVISWLLIGDSFHCYWSSVGQPLTSIFFHMDCEVTCPLIFHAVESQLARKNQDRRNIVPSGPAL